MLAVGHHLLARHRLAPVAPTAKSFQHQKFGNFVDFDQAAGYDHRVRDAYHLVFRQSSPWIICRSTVCRRKGWA
jgi:hypothetical protein